MSSRHELDLERLPLRDNELERGVPSPSLFLPDIGPTLPYITPSSPSTVENSVENSDTDSSESSDSSMDSDWEKVGEGEGKVPLGKRRRSNPVKFTEEFPASKLRRRTRQNKPPPPISTPQDPKLVKRGRGCGKCEGCIKPDCGVCTFCKDKPKFGGPGKKKQRCEKRTCTNFQHTPGSRQYLRNKRMALDSAVDPDVKEPADENKKEPVPPENKKEPQPQNLKEPGPQSVKEPQQNVKELGPQEMKEPESHKPQPQKPEPKTTESSTAGPPEIPILSSIAASMLTPLSQVMTTPPARTLDSVIKMLSGVQHSDASMSVVTEVAIPVASSVPLSAAPPLMTATPPVLSATLSPVTEKLNNTKKVHAANQVNLDEVSKKVAETRKAIQDTLNASPSKHGTPTGSKPLSAMLSVSSSPGVLTKSPTVTVTPLVAPKPQGTTGAGMEMAPGGTLVPPAKVALAMAAPIRQSISSPAVTLSVKKDTPYYKPLSSTLKPQPKILKAMAASKGSPVTENLKKMLTQQVPAPNHGLKNAQDSSSKADPKMKKGPSQGPSTSKSAPTSGPRAAKKDVPPAKPVSDPKGEKKGPTQASSSNVVKGQAQDSPSKLPAAQNPSTKPTDPRVVKVVSARGLSAKLTDPRVVKKAAAPDSSISDAKAGTGPVQNSPAQPGVKRGGNQDSPLKPASKVVKKEPAQDSMPKLEPAEQSSPPKRELRKTPASALGKGVMKCVQCGRERSIPLSRSPKFCTQRCTMQWVDANPGKAPIDAAASDDPYTEATPTPTKDSESAKVMPRALKNLQIDMAKPGTKLYHSPESDGSDSEDGPPPEPEEPNSVAITVARTNIIESLAKVIAREQQHIIANAVAAIAFPSASAVPLPSRPTPGAGAGTGRPTNGSRVLVLEGANPPIAAPSPPNAARVPKAILAKGASGSGEPKVPAKGASGSGEPPPKGASGSGEAKVPAKGAVKRSMIVTNASAAKKPKIAAKASAQSSQKSVSFSEQPEIAAAPSSSSSNPVLDTIASYLLPKKSEVAKIKLPPGLPSDIRQWSVAQVVEYFKSTPDCKGYVDVFESQEVDGIALLLLTHEALVKSLGLKLGRAVKIMNRVQELKAYRDHHASSK